MTDPTPHAPIHVKLLYFAAARERAGLEAQAVALPRGASLEALWAWLAEHQPAVAQLRPHLRVAVNLQFAKDQDALGDGDEVALIPPVAGGAPTRAWLQDAPLSLAQVEALVSHPGAGAVVSFRGTVRDHTLGREVVRLEYEVYPSMAQAKLEQVVQEVEARWEGSRCAIVHRFGVLSVGEDAVVIAVSHPHRAAAFEGCRHAIERIKEVVPIWKKEVGPDGASWVGLGS
jgi:molybdopterin synthase catalytic subunit